MFAVFVLVGWWSANLDWELVDLGDIKTCLSCLALGWTWLHMLGSGQTLSLRTACVFLSFLLTIYYCVYLAASGLVVVHRTLVVSGGSFSAGHGLCS